MTSTTKVSPGCSIAGCLVVVLFVSALGFGAWKVYRSIAETPSKPPDPLRDATSATIETNTICGASQTDLLITIPNAMHSKESVDALYELIQKGRAYVLKPGTPVVAMNSGGTVALKVFGGTSAGADCYITFEQAKSLKLEHH